MKTHLTILFAFIIPLAASGEEIDFNRDVRPILSGKCYACHGPDEAERGADLRLDTEAGSRHDMDGYAAVVPGKPDESELIYRVTTDDENDIMPPDGKGKPLTPEEVATLEKWISQGGKYAKHWSYEKPTLPEIPETADKSWTVNHPIDSFIYRKLASLGLHPSPKADHLTLARRAALDLTGIPPTWEQAQAFANDQQPDAYEKYIDSLLSSPAFGERWAQVWLDLARYADSAGYADDPPRTIWAYRDWVIRAFNENMPFDQFTIEQIAGDLLESPGNDQLIATAFHRNTLTNNEGGTNDEEFRNVAVVDRVNTTLEVWMGTTMACAQCHTHKFDPITHDEYFQLFDYFNQTEDADKKNEAPILELWSEAQIQQKTDWQKRISELKQALNSDSEAQTKARAQWLKSLSGEPEWQPLTNPEVSGGDLRPSDNHWLHLEGERAENANYQLAFPTGESKITGLRLEVSEQQKSNFVLSRIKASWKPKMHQPVAARFLRVELPGKKKMIHLAEVEIISNGTNIATSATATQSSTGFSGPANLAIDGNTDGDYAKKSVSHTAVEDNPWFQIDLKKEFPIDSFTIWNRTGNQLESRLEGYQITLLDDTGKVVWEQAPADVPRPSTSFAMTDAIQLDFKTAIADYEQKGFPAGAAISNKTDGKTGWAIGGKAGVKHNLTLTLPKPVQLSDGTLTITLEQSSEHKQHLLTDFRISTTSDTNITQWSRIPGDVRELIISGKLEHPKVVSYYQSVAPLLAGERKELAKLEKQLKDAKPHTSVPVMRDLPTEKHRVTKLQIRGNYLTTGHVLTRGVPAVFHPLREDLPNNRLALAHWLIDPENPLTARVIVNRFWERIFGVGIVQTSEEFGSQGELPSHPELLDWLALNFQADWDIKALLRGMVMSSTYQQQTETTPELLEVDPFNRYYARGPRFRISAEMVRDQALFVSGLLSQKMYGAPVKPPQPNLGLKAAFGGSTDWVTSQGEDKFRRGIYTNWRRSSPYPSMATFDAPNREICISSRGRTNTPLQALVTLNDPVYIEAAQALARKVLADGGSSVSDKLTFAWRETLLRDPTSREIERMTDLIHTAQERFTAAPDDAKRMATEPIGKAPESIDLAELAAWTVAGNVILNLDELFLKR
ncbi:MAG: DUF1553 domain-containing protein [Verrucomicrobiales bacterium]|nr:DUF1553 domain-containing protein [Verrucomicrobiales bacterium]